MNVPIVAELLAVHHRHVERRNDVLGQRKEEASELVGNCEQWTQLLIRMLEAATEASQLEGPQAAQGIVRRQQADYLGLDYQSLRNDSQILAHLREDERFMSFVRSCEQFYNSALDLKELAVRHFESSDAATDSLETFHRRLEALLQAVRREGRAVRTIEPS